MTAIGIIAEPQQAILWADTLFFTDGVPAGHHRKLVLNQRARLAGCGAGSGGLCRVGREAVLAATDVHQIAELLPTVLSRHARRLGSEDQAVRASFLAAGWSQRWRRIVAFAFHAPSFRAETVAAYASPTISLAGMFAPTFDDVSGSAREQIADLEHSHGCRIDGRVFAAAVSASGVEERTLLDLGGANFEEGI